MGLFLFETFNSNSHINLKCQIYFHYVLEQVNFYHDHKQFAKSLVSVR